MKKVVILQHRMLHYRTHFFERVREDCLRRGIEIYVVHGQATRRELAKNDEGSLAWADKVTNLVWEVGDRDMLWQPFPRAMRNADLVVIMQESRILSNYPLLLRRRVTTLKVAYWGHGANLQSTAPAGLREFWKRALLSHVDWWLAYTQSTVDILRLAEFPVERITRLDNTIDTSRFRSDLAATTEADLSIARQSLGIVASTSVGLFCGSLYREKRLEFLVAAAEEIHARASDFHCVILGDGPSMPFLTAAATSRPWIHVLGAKKGLEKALYFRLATVMLNPGAVGVHIVDAFASGLPLFTTKSALHGPEFAYLREGKNGFATADSIDNYASSVVALLGDPDRLAEVSMAAFASADRYTIGNMVERFGDGIARCLATPKRR